MYFVFYSHYKTKDMCEGGIKQKLDPKNSTVPRPRPPVLKFLDPPLGDVELMSAWLSAMGGLIVLNGV